VLCGVNPLAGRNLKCEVGKEKETDEKEYILERSADGLIWICHFDERSAECRCLKSGEDVARSFRPHAPGDEWDRPFRGETTPCDRAADRQEASVESRIWPITLNRQASRLAIGKHRNPLCTRKPERGGHIESRVRLQRSFDGGPEQRELDVSVPVSADRDLRGACRRHERRRPPVGRQHG